MLKQQKNISATDYHKPVMLSQVLEGLNINPSGHYVDLTFGGGGHSYAILNRLNKDGRLYVFDQDSEAKENLIEDSRLIFIEDNFSNLSNHLRLYRDSNIDGILADLGVSSHQIDTPQRGFSTRFDAPLDLRMNKNETITAKDIINNYEERPLANIFKNYGELKNSYSIAKRIVSLRTTNPINTTFQLKEALLPLSIKGQENKFFAMVFQALRIEVNNELENLKTMLIQATNTLKQGGRLVCLSYHSLEDRLVKNYMKYGNFEAKTNKDFFGNVICDLKMLTKKPIEASEEEQIENPRSRSAKLRIGEKI
ncbi:MAG: 16S rRNA (cytosine(1402)-N(4))-methyltransferase RsmH [Bacteroidales bacterium]|nr:16S rRNA (cytosine(1402)-N(4))-methyltransferase RsmH [Bacteroidales bacterium]